MVVLHGSSGGAAEEVLGRSPNKNVPARARPRPPALWTIQDVVQWFQRHCGDLGERYSHLFHENNVNGRILLRMNVSALERMGIVSEHCEEIFREILKLKFKSDILELQDLERQTGFGANPASNSKKWLWQITSANSAILETGGQLMGKILVRCLGSWSNRWSVSDSIL